MMRSRFPILRLVLLSIAVASAPLRAQQTAPPAAQPAAAAPAADSADVASPEAIVTALYDVISGPASQERNWDRFRSLFLPGARLVFTQTTRAGATRLHALTVEDYVRLAAPGFGQGGGFWESDIGRRIDRFGNVAQVFTTYESRNTAADGPVFARGINSVQLVRHEGRWWVVNLAWDEERPNNPIPPEYLAPRP